MTEPKIIEILVGTINLQSGGTFYKTKLFILHERYEGDPTYIYDIALVGVEGSIQFDEKVKPIPLSPNYIEGGQKLETTGWGRTSVSLS